MTRQTSTSKAGAFGAFGAFGFQRGLRLLVASCGVALAAAAVAHSGCTTHPPFVNGPELYGVTVPLPPPSYSAANFVRTQFNGGLPTNFGDDAVRVSLWVSGDANIERGYFVANDVDTFEFVDVEVAVAGTCLTIWFEDEFDSTSSASNSYRLGLELASQLCLPENRCTPTDEEGACLCLEPAFAGCGSLGE